MRCLVLLVICVLTGPTSGQAGPWPREKGQIFVATTGTYRFADDAADAQGEGGLYLEYGLGARTTLGVSAMDNLTNYSHAYAFVRRALSPPDRHLKLAASLSLGASRRGYDWGPMARLDLSVGRATDLVKPGWWTVTAAIEDHSLWDDPAFKLDATFGLHLTQRIKTIIDVEASHRHGEADALTLRTSVAWDTAKGNTLVFGVEVQQGSTLGLRAGWWRSF